ncbi:heterokaryon incompatibility protein-domain-containing protein [Pyrenochaeta sp. MPI-SDFR-AT-0127]|nr:heterokaryon incompatibility protein-domain-containing protein [Pyrenochaeta sp. MPI-SDFR-AT-0127]
MRLLKCLPGDDYFELISVSDDHAPPYAILSHTWTDGQEVTYNELLAETGTDKRGYAKIRFCGERAAADGLEYFWVDTCCIDKATNDELCTAINSMFRWYQRAAKCYVYLTDVSVPEEVNNAEAFPISWKQAFRRSRWFTRGWTLQELLAPTSVEFFSQDGKRLGSRVSLEQEIHEITRIPIGALRGVTLTEFSVDARMSWAARRTTTVKEDKVYCLLGIFEVFLPLIYGEGEDHATLRLKEEIQKQQDRLRAREVLSTTPIAEVEQRTMLDVKDDPVDVVPSEQHDLEAGLADLASERPERLDWQHSVVDLLELLGLQSDTRFRGWLADALDVRAGTNGSARQDNALRKAIINRLAAAELAWIEVIESRFQGRRCFNCGGAKHWETECKADCGKCTTIAFVYCSSDH